MATTAGPPPAKGHMLRGILLFVAWVPLVTCDAIVPRGHALQSISAALRGSDASQRRLDTGCSITTLRLLPPPAVKDYQACVQDKLNASSDHDWSVPGAELDAQTQCWCAHDLTTTIKQYQCCEHPDLYPMCTLDCSPNCTSDLATTCIQECPSMCFEASEYVVEEGLCSRCNWPKCWPVLKCLTEHAKQRIESGTLEKTCHEADFNAGEELRNYWTCWRNVPKHSSHWNTLSAVIHCACREGMVEHTRGTSCCGSVIYGGGICDVQCLPEAECSSQKAQTCIHTCVDRCRSETPTPSKECLEECLQTDSPCRRYASCRPPMLAGHVCDDGRWPEASSGCCAVNRTDAPGQVLGCPQLCDTQQVWRLDGGRSIPWWSRWQPDGGVVAQCTCKGCPTTHEEALNKLSQSLEEDLWENGQMMLVNIAQREGLVYGPNRRMQELMVIRNERILAAFEMYTDRPVESSFAINQINLEFTQLLTTAARTFGDDGYLPPKPTKEPGRPEGDLESFIAFAAIAGLCTLAIVFAIGCATKLILHRRRECPVTAFDNDDVVIGNPVPGSAETNNDVSVTGAPVTVSAATKATRTNGKVPAEELS